VRLELARFTVVGATTRAGLLTGPLRDRFGLSLPLDVHSVDDLSTVVGRSASILGIPLTPEASRAIAMRARGTPRIANRLLRRIRDYAQVARRDSVDELTSLEAMDLNGVDEAGLDPLDRRYLQAVIRQYNGGPVGVSAIAATLNEERDTLIDMVEPFLLAEGFLNRTSRGRVATAKACRHLGYPGTPDERLPL